MMTYIIQGTRKISLAREGSEDGEKNELNLIIHTRIGKLGGIFMLVPNFGNVSRLLRDVYIQTMHAVFECAIGS